MKKILFLVFLAPIIAEAHPVAFKDSVGIMGYHSPNLAHNQVNYSFKHWWALGVHHFKIPMAEDSQHATVATTNFLLKRWNGEASQANIYALIGGGQSELSGLSKPVGFGLIQFDIEDRKYYFLIKHSQLGDESTTDLRQTTARIGLAPYVGGYTDLHSWIILEWSQMDFPTYQLEDTTPLLRFFYKNLLFEIGQSFRGLTKFNYIAHF